LQKERLERIAAMSARAARIQRAISGRSMTRIERAFGILLILSDGGTATATALARRFEVSVRTIYRDVEMLSASGVPVYAERGAQGGYRLHEGFFLPPVAFSRDEAVAILLGLALVRGLKVPPFAREIESAERKLVGVLPRRLRSLLSETRRLIGFEQAAPDAFHPEKPPVSPPPRPDGGEARAVELFLKAVLDGTRIRFTYRSPYRDKGVPEAIEAEPLGLLWDRDLWYLIGRKLALSGSSGERRLWRADRVESIEASTFRSTAGPEFDVRTLLGRIWLGGAMAQWSQSSPVRVRMKRHLAERLKGDWYFRFAAFASSGQDEYVMTYGENDRDTVLELLRWLGPDAELIEPAEWRRALKDELGAMAARYA
jgi:predicted DNA-binding transcriptional regulator YafY